MSVAFSDDMIRRGIAVSIFPDNVTRWEDGGRALCRKYYNVGGCGGWFCR